MRCQRLSSSSGHHPTRWSVRRSRDTLLGRDETIGEGSNRPPSRNKTIRPGDRARRQILQPRPLNREALTLPTIPQRTADHPEHTIERGNHNSQTDPKNSDGRINDEPLHHEADRAGATVTTTRNPTLRAHTTRVIERARKRNTITKTHFQSNLSNRVGWYVVASLCCTVSDDVNTVLFQHAPNFVGNHPIHASNADTGVDFAVPVLHDFDLERDAVQAEDDFPAQ